MNPLIPITDLWKWIIGRPCASACVAVTRLRLEKRGLESRMLHPGEKLRCVKGTLWLTVEREGRDVILPAGAVYTGDRRTRVLIEALEDSVVGFQPD